MPETMPQDLRANAREHVVPHYTKGSSWNDESLVVMDRGEGCYVFDTDGNRYLDGLAGLFCTNIGHGRADIAAAASKQMERLAFYPTWGYANPPVIEAATKIANEAPGDLNDVFFVSSGSEAVESAIKFSRNYFLAKGEPERYKVIAREWAYHGTTLGALAVTGIPKFRDPFLPNLWDGARHVRNTYGSHLEDVESPGDYLCVKAVEEMVLAEGPETIAMIIAEPVQNGRGAVVPPDGYWQELRRICDTYGILLCADEVICSFGRFGHYFASERFDVVPDMITFAKGVTSAYSPLGGMIVRRPLLEEIWESDMGAFVHGSTFGGHPVSCAVAVANMRALDDDDVFANVRTNEGFFRAGLDDLMARHQCVKEVRGAGYFYAVELGVSHDAGIDLSADQAAALQSGVLAGFVRDSKLLIRPDDRGATMLTLSPPLIADEEVLGDIFDRMDQILASTDHWLTNN